jgi:hypothetical protein
MKNFDRRHSVNAGGGPMFAVQRTVRSVCTARHCRTDYDRMEHDHGRQRHSTGASRTIGIGPCGCVGGGSRVKTRPRIAPGRLRVEADVVDLCPPRPARIKGYNERSCRAGHRRDAQRTRMGESLHRWAVSTLILPCTDDCRPEVPSAHGRENGSARLPLR